MSVTAWRGVTASCDEGGNDRVRGLVMGNMCNAHGGLEGWGGEGEGAGRG